MRRFIKGACFAVLVTALFVASAGAQNQLTWDQVKGRFEANSPTLRSGQIGIDESKANEITAYLRPNPTFTMSVDGTQVAPHDGVWQPFAGTFESPNVSYLHERQHKRELRLESAQKAAGIAVFGQADLERGLLFSLRSAFVGTMQAKAVLKVVADNLTYWDQVLKISRDRFQVGDLAQTDLDRLELMRVQFEADVQTAEVNLRTSKIQLLLLLNDRIRVEQFDILGLYEFNDQPAQLDDFRKTAVDNRPDLKTALQAVDKAKTDHQLAVANGSTDPTISGWYTHNASTNNPAAINTVGASVSVPLRILDRNQGEKLRTQLDIDRNQKRYEAAQAQVFSDVDTAYAQVNSSLILLRPFRVRYLQQSTRVRNTVHFSWEHGGASLLDFLNAEQDYRGVQLSYVNLIGAYLTAAAQLNMAVGREVIQ